MLDDYINNLVKNIPPREKPYELDLVVEGGVFNGCYEIGVLLFIKALEKKNYIKINRISGCSIGSLAALKFLTDELETSEDDYTTFRQHFRQHFNLNILRERVNAYINSLSDETFNKIKKNILYINYFDSDRKQEVVKHKYSTRKRLVDTILKSCHVPYLINGQYSHGENDKGLDGGLPYIFPEREKDPNKFILYLSVSHLSKLKNILYTRHENTIHGRVLEGILDAYNFFLREKPTMICSFVNNWSLLDFTVLRVKHSALVVGIQILCLFRLISGYTLPWLEKIELYHRMRPIFREICRDYVLHFCF